MSGDLERPIAAPGLMAEVPGIDAVDSCRSAGPALGFVATLVAVLDSNRRRVRPLGNPAKSRLPDRQVISKGPNLHRKTGAPATSPSGFRPTVSRTELARFQRPVTDPELLSEIHASPPSLLLPGSRQPHGPAEPEPTTDETIFVARPAAMLPLGR